MYSSTGYDQEVDNARETAVRRAWEDHQEGKFLIIHFSIYSGHKKIYTFSPQKKIYTYDLWIDFTCVPAIGKVDGVGDDLVCITCRAQEPTFLHYLPKHHRVSVTSDTL